MVDLKEVKQCPACGSDNIQYDDEKEEVVCNECGNVFAELTPEEEKKFEDASDVI